jgi:hypothetical protein
VLHGDVAFAGCVFESRAIQNRNGATRILDEAAALENSGGQADAGASGTQHLSEEFMSHAKDFGIDAVLAHQQPTRQALFNFMQPVARRNLGYLQSLNEYVAVPDQPQFRRRAQGIDQQRGLHSQATSGNLHDRPMRSAVKSNREGRADNAFLANNRDFDASAVAGKDNYGGHAVVEEVCKLDPGASFVQDMLLGKVHRHQMFAEQVVFTLWNGAQDRALDELSGGISSYALSCFPAICTFQSAPLQLPQACQYVLGSGRRLAVEEEVCLFDSVPKEAELFQA